MGNNYFRFKRFTVFQDNVSMRVNTDGVLLGAWFSLPFANPSVLDVGTGTGVVALMAAQRISGTGSSDFSVEAIEIDSSSSVQAQKNFSASEWKKDLLVYNADFRTFADYSGHKYNIIVSNPPYFNNSLKNPSETKRNARHTDKLPYEDLVRNSRRLLLEGGVLSLILPPEEQAAFNTVAESYGFIGKRMCRVYSRRGDTMPIRIMAEYVSTPSEKTEASVSEDLFILDSDSGYTEEYKALTRDFYLKF